MTPIQREERGLWHDHGEEESRIASSDPWSSEDSGSRFTLSSAPMDSGDRDRDLDVDSIRPSHIWTHYCRDSGSFNVLSNINATICGSGSMESEFSMCESPMKHPDDSGPFGGHCNHQLTAEELAQCSPIERKIRSALNPLLNPERRERCQDQAQ